MKKILFILVLCFCFKNTNCQITINAELASKLQGKDNFNDVWQTVYDYYTNLNLSKNNKANREFKKWNRWAWWASRNLNKEGKIANDYNEVKRTFEILHQENKDRSNTGAWYPLNTTTYEYKNGNIVGSGRVDRITFHPYDANTIYIGSSGGGLWKTSDNGATWNCLTNTLPNCGVTGVAIDPNNTNNIYIATGDGDTGGPGYFVFNFQFRKSSYGILKSNNDGATWSPMGNSQTVMGTRNPYKLVKLKGFTNRFVCATTSGVMTSLDNGNTWNIMNSGSSYFDIEQDPDDNNIIYLCSENHVIKSTNGGQTFEYVPSSSFSPALGSCQRTAISFNDTNNDQLYLIQMGVGGTTERLYRSSDSGLSFSTVNNTQEISDNGGEYMGPLAVSGNTIVTGAVNLFRSIDGGVNFTDNTNWFANSTTSPQFIHADIHDLAFNPNNGQLYAATDGGVFRSTDDGNTWTFASFGLNTLQFYHMDGLDSEVNTFAGGFQDNGSAFSTDAGNKMDFFGSGDGYQVKFTPTESNIIYFDINQKISKYNRSSNSIIDVPTDVTWFQKIACHPSNNQIAYFGTASKIYKTTNQGISTSVVANFGANNNANSHAGGLATTAANGDYVYAANHITVSKSINQGSNWTTISGNTGWVTNFTAITDISACNGGPEILYVTTNSTGNAKVLFTQDGGNSWLNITGTLPIAAIVYSVACHDNGDAYIGTNLGIFYQGISMSDWIPYSNGMPLIEVSDLFINENTNKITASTFGRGMWQSDLYNSCNTYLSLSGNISGYNRFQSSNLIESNHDMNGNYGNDLAYKANTKIRLTSGFAAREGSKFRATIQPCGQGVFFTGKKVVAHE